MNFRSTASPGRRLALASLAALAAAGCLYSFSGGGGLPAHIETIYVPPVENRTARGILSEEVTQGLLDAVRGRLGAQLAAEDAADAAIRVTLTDYRDDALAFRGEEGQGADVFQRRVTVAASVEIEDLTRGTMMWNSASVRGTGEYAPDEESEEEGLRVAVEDLIQKILDGAQAQW